MRIWLVAAQQNENKPGEHGKSYYTHLHATTIVATNFACQIPSVLGNISNVLRDGGVRARGCCVGRGALLVRAVKCQRGKRPCICRGRECRWRIRRKATHRHWLHSIACYNIPGHLGAPKCAHHMCPSAVICWFECTWRLYRAERTLGRTFYCLI